MVRQQLRQFDAGRICRNCLEWPAILDWCEGFWVVRLEVRGAAPQPDLNDCGGGLRKRMSAASRLRGQQVSERKPGRPRGNGCMEKGPAADLAVPQSPTIDAGLHVALLECTRKCLRGKRINAH